LFLTYDFKFCFCETVLQFSGRRKGSGRKLRMAKRKKTSDGRKEEDRLSDLLDVVLLHIMEFLLTREAVQSCVLSKRWKNLWKSVNTLSFRSST